MLGLFVGVMRWKFEMKWLQVFRVVGSGIGCGLFHHAPLFCYGMRSYSDPKMLLYTIMIEWPPVVSGLFTITRLCCSPSAARAASEASPPPSSQATPTPLPSGDRRSAAWLFAGLVLALLVGQMQIKLWSTRQMLYELMPYVPAEYFQAAGALYVWSTTCTALKTGSPKQCTTDGNSRDLWVIAAAPKGGAVLSAQMSIDIATVCGRCVGVAGRNGTGAWPSPTEELPSYDSDLLFAIANMQRWPEYAAAQNVALPNGQSSVRVGTVAAETERRSRCVLIIRDPLSRLRSLYMYARAGRETWFKTEGVSAELEALHQANADGVQEETAVALQASVNRFMEWFGLAYLKSSHGYMSQNLELGCTAFKFEDLLQNYNATVGKWLDVWGISQEPDVRRALLDALASQAPEAQTAATNHHVSSGLYSAAFKVAVAEALQQHSAEVRKLLIAQRAHLGYNS